MYFLCAGCHEPVLKVKTRRKIHAANANDTGHVINDTGNDLPQVHAADANDTENVKPDANDARNVIPGVLHFRCRWRLRRKLYIASAVGGGRVVRRCWVNFQCRGVLQIWMIVGQEPIALAVGAGKGCLDIFLSSITFLFFLPLCGRRPDID